MENIPFEDFGLKGVDFQTNMSSFREQDAVQFLINRGFYVMRCYRRLYQYRIDGHYPVELENTVNGISPYGTLIKEKKTIEREEVKAIMGDENWDKLKLFLDKEKDGLPDVLIINQNRTECFFAELKVDKDKLSARQLVTLMKLAKFMKVEVHYFYKR